MAHPWLVAFEAEVSTARLVHLSNFNPDDTRLRTAYQSLPSSASGVMSVCFTHSDQQISSEMRPAILRQPAQGQGARAIRLRVRRLRARLRQIQRQHSTAVKLGRNK